MARFLVSHCVFPTPDIHRTAEFYSARLGFRAAAYLDAMEPHICLYRDSTEIILTKANAERVLPNRELYGYGYDAYFVCDDLEELQKEYLTAGVKFARLLAKTDTHSRAFVIEDTDGRWIGFGPEEDGKQLIINS